MTTLAVYDCMLFFRAAARPRLARPHFDFVHDGRVTLCLSPDVLAEIRDVLTRPKLVARFPALDACRLFALLLNDRPSLDQLVILRMGAYPDPHIVGTVLHGKRAVVETYSR